MIGTLVRINWLNLKRDYVALGLTFILPIVFFSIFAGIFGRVSGGGGSGGGGPTEIRLIVVDEDQTEVSRRFVEAIDALEALKVETRPSAGEENPDPTAYTRDDSRLAVRTGKRSVAVIVPEGFGDRFGSFAGDGPTLDLIYDPVNPIAQNSVAGLMQAASFQAAPDILMESGLEQLEQFGGALTPEQQTAIDTIRPYLRGEQPWSALDDEESGDAAEETDDADAGGGFTGLVQVNAVSARTADDQTDDDDGIGSMVAYYAAGIGVMFLLFSMAGAGGSLLEEEESGSLDRVLSSNVGMNGLLVGKWVFFSIVGIAQVALMFVWGAVMFDLPLWGTTTLIGTVAMTLVTGAAAAAFGILLATICRSRGQLGGMSTIVILIMSALGGSMVPRFVAEDFFNTTSRFTFNGWALDGYLKVFWYNDPGSTTGQLLASIAPELAVLAGSTVVLLLLARGFARRWETA